MKQCGSCGSGIANIATSKNVLAKITMFRTETVINTLTPLLTGRLDQSDVLEMAFNYTVCTIFRGT